MYPPESRLNPPGRRSALRDGMSRLLNPRVLGALALTGALSACNTVVLDPAGDIAQQQGDLVVLATVLMLLIVVPVMAAVVIFAWRYRASNTKAKYDPDWDHSTQLELLIWTAPLLIIICLGAVTWTSTHLLDPFRSISRVDKETALAPNVKPLEIEVVALDWKWLFIYPEQGIATVNEMVVPVGRPVSFKITSSSVMNAFYVPAMAGMIYAMPGMQTRLNAIMNKEGKFHGLSANYSGAGFSNMRFAANSVSDAGFDAWVAEVKAGKSEGAAAALDRSVYLQLEKPSEKVPTIRYATVEDNLFKAVVDMCVEPGKMCMSEMMAIDAQGGLGKAGIRNVSMLAYDKNGRQATLDANSNPGEAVHRELAWVRALCDQIPGMAPAGTIKAPTDLRSLNGAGLTAPQSIGMGQDEQVSASEDLSKPAHVSLNTRN